MILLYRLVYDKIASIARKFVHDTNAQRNSLFTDIGITVRKVRFLFIGSVAVEE